MAGTEVLSGVDVAAGVGALPTLSDGFWGQNSGLPGMAALVTLSPNPAQD